MKEKLPLISLVVLVVVFGTIAAIKINSKEIIPNSGITTVNSEAELNLASVADHNSRDDCWTIINNEVYDVTDYIPLHPGGIKEIMKACGVDSTNLFATRGGEGSHSDFAYSLLDNYKVSVENSPTTNSQESNTGGVNTPKETNPTETFLTLNTQTVAEHNTRDDCWIIVSGKVYQVTNYIPLHPGGARRIENVCGEDATIAFDTRGGEGSHSDFAYSLLENYLIGSLGQEVVESTTQVTAVENPPNANSYDDDDDDEWEDEDEYEDDD